MLYALSAARYTRPQGLPSGRSKHFIVILSHPDTGQRCFILQLLRRVAFEAIVGLAMPSEKRSERLVQQGSRQAKENDSRRRLEQAEEQTRQAEEALRRSLRRLGEGMPKSAEEDRREEIQLALLDFPGRTIRVAGGAGEERPGPPGLRRTLARGEGDLRRRARSTRTLTPRARCEAAALRAGTGGARRHAGQSENRTRRTCSRRGPARRLRQLEPPPPKPCAASRARRAKPGAHAPPRQSEANAAEGGLRVGVGGAVLQKPYQASLSARPLTT